MKLILCLAAAAALAACSTAPAPATVQTGQAAPAAQTTAAKPAAPTKVAAKDKGEGKQCTVASSLGTNMRKKTCTTQAEREQAAADGKDSVDQFDKVISQTSLPRYN